MKGRKDILVLLAVLVGPGTDTIRRGERLVGGVATSVRARPALGSNRGLSSGLGSRKGEVRLSNVSVRVAVARGSGRGEGAVTTQGNVGGKSTLRGKTTSDTRVVRATRAVSPQPEVVPPGESGEKKNQTLNQDQKKNKKHASQKKKNKKHSSQTKKTKKKHKKKNAKEDDQTKNPKETKKKKKKKNKGKKG